MVCGIMTAMCYVCGKDSVYNNLCTEHYLDSIKLITAPASAEVIQCKRCGRFFIKGRWVETTIEQAIKKMVKIKEKSDNFFCTYNKERHAAVCEASLYVPQLKKEKKERYVIKIVIKTQLCRRCSLAAAGYYEAVIQCRRMNEEEIKKIISRNQWAVTKVEYKKEGIDIYFSDKKAAESIVRHLGKQGFKTTKSHKLIGKRDGRDVYRFYYAVMKNV